MINRLGLVERLASVDRYLRTGAAEMLGASFNRRPELKNSFILRIPSNISLKERAGYQLIFRAWNAAFPREANKPRVVIDYKGFEYGLRGKDTVARYSTNIDAVVLRPDFFDEPQKEQLLILSHEMRHRIYEHDRSVELIDLPEQPRFMGFYSERIIGILEGEWPKRVSSYDPFIDEHPDDDYNSVFQERDAYFVEWLIDQSPCPQEILTDDPFLYRALLNVRDVGGETVINQWLRHVRDPKSYQEETIESMMALANRAIEEREN